MTATVGTFTISTEATAALQPGALILSDIEHDNDGSLRVYVASRHLGVHVHVEDPATKARVLAAAHRYPWLLGLTAGDLCDCPGGVPIIGSAS